MASVQLVTVSGKGQIVLPKKVRESLGIRQGTRLLMVERNGKISLDKAEKLLNTRKTKSASLTMLASEKALAKGWLSKEEDEAWADL